MKLLPELSHHYEYSKEQANLYFLIVCLLLQLAALPTKVDAQHGTLPVPAPTSTEQTRDFAQISCEELYLLLADARLEVFGSEITAALADKQFQVTQPDTLQHLSTPTEANWAIEAVGLPVDDPSRALHTLPYSRTVKITTTTGLTFTYTSLAPTLLSADAAVDPLSATIQELVSSGEFTFGPDLTALHAETDPDCEPSGYSNRHEEYQLQLLINAAADRGYLVSKPEADQQSPFRIMEMSIIAEDNSTSWQKVIDAVLLAGKLKVDMIKLSVGGTSSTDAEKAQLEAAMRYAAKRGVIMIIAGGNWPTSTEPVYPACIAVPNRLLAFASELSPEGVHQLYPHGTMTCATDSPYNMAAPGIALPVVDAEGVETLVQGSSFSPYPLIIGLSLLLREYPDLSDPELLDLFMKKFHAENFPENSYDIQGFHIPPEYLLDNMPAKGTTLYLPLIKR